MHFTKRCERYKKGLTSEKSIIKILYCSMTWPGVRNRVATASATPRPAGTGAPSIPPGPGPGGAVSLSAESGFPRGQSLRPSTATICVCSGCSSGPAGPFGRHSVTCATPGSRIVSPSMNRSISEEWRK